jgi:hypothetical protein
MGWESYGAEYLRVLSRRRMAGKVRDAVVNEPLCQ